MNAFHGRQPYLGTERINHFDPKMSFDEKFAASGMDFTIKRSLVRYATSPNGFPTTSWPKHHVLLRSDTLAPLSIVSDKFQIVQPRTVFNFFRETCEHMGWNMDSASVLFNGTRYWALADTGRVFDVLDPNDIIKGFCLLSTSCDGSMPTEARYLTHRLWCNNQLPMIRATKGLIKINHRSKFDPVKVRESLGISLEKSLDELDQEFVEQMNLFRSLASTRLASSSCEYLTNETFAIDPDDKQTTASKRINELFATGNLIGSSGIEDKTLWRWLNCVTQYADHEARAKSADHRLNNSWFGTGADLKKRALEVVTNYVMA